ncbi:MAG: AIR synthase family protein [Fusobacteriaceae bacterium]
MKIGKLNISDLKSLILDNIKNNREEVLSNPEIGGDCAVISCSGEKLIYLSSDPITGSTKDIGKLGVNINANDIATSGTAPLGIMLTILAPPNTQKNELKKIIKEAQKECNELNMSILGGHTEITDAVNRIVISVTAIGIGEKKELKRQNNLKAGDCLLITKGIGIEGIGIIANEKEYELIKKFGKDFVERAKENLKHTSVVKEGILGKGLSKGMHDATEGGLLGAIWEFCELCGFGVEIYEDKIYMSKETREISNYYKINPLRLISSGTMLVLVEKKDLEELKKKYSENNIESYFIGILTESKEKLIINSIGEKTLIEEPESDELYKVL